MEERSLQNNNKDITTSSTRLNLKTWLAIGWLVLALVLMVVLIALTMNGTLTTSLSR
jgi:hypothetical protein